MTDKKPSDPVEAWPETTLRMRVDACRLQLLVLDLLTDEEHTAICHRIQGWVQNSNKPPVVPGLYRHFKGGVYNVVGVVMNVAGQDSEPMILYYKDSTGPLVMYVRPVANFMEIVTFVRDGVQVSQPRFVPLAGTGS